MTEEAEAAWMELIGSNPAAMLGNTDCTPGYYNNEGQLLNTRERFAMAGYPLGPVAFSRSSISGGTRATSRVSSSREWI